MSATRTPSHNRISPYLDTAKALPALPIDPAARQAIRGDAVLRTILALQGLLTSEDPAVVLKAAGMILDLEKTSMRHGREITGSVPSISTPEPAPEQPEISPEELSAMSEEERFEFYVEFTRRNMQAEYDAKGAGVVVSREEAELVVRTTLAAAGRLANPPPGRS